jgi:hypothetical protein
MEIIADLGKAPVQCYPSPECETIVSTNLCRRVWPTASNQRHQGDPCRKLNPKGQKGNDHETNETPCFRDGPARGRQLHMALLSQPVVKLIDTHRACFSEFWAPPRTKAFLEVHGTHSGAVVLSNSNLAEAAKPAVVGAEVPEGSLKLSGDIEGWSREPQ